MCPTGTGYLRLMLITIIGNLTTYYPHNITKQHTSIWITVNFFYKEVWLKMNSVLSNGQTMSWWHFLKYLKPSLTFLYYNFWLSIRQHLHNTKISAMICWFIYSALVLWHFYTCISSLSSFWYLGMMMMKHIIHCLINNMVLAAIFSQNDCHLFFSRRTWPLQKGCSHAVIDWLLEWYCIYWDATELFLYTVTSTGLRVSVVRWVEGSGSLCLCFRSGAHALCWSGEVTPQREGK